MATDNSTKSSRSCPSPLHPLLPPLSAGGIPATWTVGPNIIPQVASDGQIDGIKAKEDKVTATLAEDDREWDLMLWRSLRVRYPHQSSSLTELDREIAFERRKKGA